MQSNLKTYKDSQELRHLVLRLTKESSSFLYFILESNEGLCFYSTLPYEIGDENRDIELNIPIEFEGNVLSLLEHFYKEHPFEIIENEIIKDN